ncbi:rod shape-determining protein MreD [Neobacillus sp. PS3-34]|uniref:rod shape-determining protein MreD n=1 Tax=Neobacillus sp. PS3-34 TaxID=3070678 RepID=UPI0027E19209|nr:rod shape-determining protein MreD [Neobacillus sp. PS3-34]WML47385.1 rod shape-determining protein MreD [Neobacillus sp. PS3-34]
MRKLLLPLLFGFFFIFESLFVQYMPSEAFGRPMILVPHFLLSAILFLSIFGSRKHGIIYGIVFGLLFDVVYTEIIGIYLFMFPVAAYFVAKMMRILHANIFIASMITLISIAFVEIGVYEMNLLIHVTDLSFVNFIQMRFYPTLLLNLAFIIVAAYPLKRHFEKLSEELGSE